MKTERMGSGQRNATLRWGFGLFVIGLACLCALRIAARGLPIMFAGHDMMGPLDGAWRVLNGQRPSLDFYLELGPAVLLIDAVGLWMARGAAHGLAYAAALTGVAAGLWMFALARNRLTAGGALLAGWYCALLVLAPIPLGFDFRTLTEAMIYNRYGYGLLAIILMELLAPVRPDSESRGDGLSSGIALGMCLFIKPTYFMVGTVFVAAACLLRQDTARRLLYTAAGFALVVGAMSVYLRGDLAAYYRDLSTLAAARMGQSPPRRFLNAVTRAVIPGILLLALAAVGTRALDGAPAWRAFPGRRWRCALCAVMVTAAGILLMATNFQPAGLPLGFLVAIVITDAIWADRRVAGQENQRRMIVGFLIAALLGLPLAGKDAAGLAYDFFKSYRPDRPGTVLFTSDSLRTLRVLGPSSPWDGEEYSGAVNDGMELLRRSSGPLETVFSLDFSNVFSFGLQRPPARGGSVCLYYDSNFNEVVGPPPERIIGEVDLVMVPKDIWDPYAFAHTLQVYGPYLETHYRRVAESRWWVLYRRVDRNAVGQPAFHRP